MLKSGHTNRNLRTLLLAGLTAVLVSSGTAMAMAVDTTCGAFCGFEPTVAVSTSNLNAGAGPSSLKLTVSKPLKNHRISGFKVSMPFGLVGNITATERCSEGEAKVAAAQKLAHACNPNTQVGVVRVTAPLFSGQSVTEEGYLYSGLPDGGEPGKLITYIPDMGKIASNEALLLASPVTLRGNGEGIDTEVKIPKGLWSANITKIEVEIDGTTNRTGTGPFMINQTHCLPAGFKLGFQGTYGLPFGTASDLQYSVETGYTAVNCDALDYTPNLEVAAAKSPSGAPELSTTITQGFGEAATKRLAFGFKLPVNLAALPKPCSDSQFAARTPTSDSTISAIEVESWILPASLKGAVHLCVGGRVLMRLTGFVDLTLEGEIKISPTGTSTLTVDGMPPMPVTRITASEIKAFQLPKSCSESAVTMEASSYSGKGRKVNLDGAALCGALGIKSGDEPSSKLKVGLTPKKKGKPVKLSAKLTLDRAITLKSIRLKLGAGKRSIVTNRGRLKRLASKPGQPRVGRLVLYGTKTVTLSGVPKAGIVKFRSKGKGPTAAGPTLRVKGRTLLLDGLYEFGDVGKLTLNVDGRRGRFIKAPRRSGVIKFRAETLAKDGKSTAATHKLRFKPGG